MFWQCEMNFEMLLNIRDRVNVTPLVLTDLYDKTIHLFYCFTGSHFTDGLMRETGLSCNTTRIQNLSREDKSTGTHSLGVSHRHTPAWSVDRPINGASLCYFLTSNWCEIYWPSESGAPWMDFTPYVIIIYIHTSHCELILGLNLCLGHLSIRKQQRNVFRRGDWRAIRFRKVSRAFSQAKLDTDEDK